MLKEKICNDCFLGGEIFERRSSGGRISTTPREGLEGSGMILRATSESAP